MSNTYVIGGLLLVIGIIGGYVAADYDVFSTNPAVNTTAPQADDGHMHTHEEYVEVADDESIPSVTLEVLEDPKGGWNAHLTTENFTFTPENASLAHVPGEGHAHIYVDGEKINRVYGNWYHLGTLEPGTHEVRVNLSANNHALYTHQGEEIADTQTVTVPAQ